MLPCASICAECSGLSITLPEFATQRRQVSVGPPGQYHHQRARQFRWEVRSFKEQRSQFPSPRALSIHLKTCQERPIPHHSPSQLVPSAHHHLLPPIRLGIHGISQLWGCRCQGVMGMLYLQKVPLCPFLAMPSTCAPALKSRRGFASIHANTFPGQQVLHNGQSRWWPKGWQAQCSTRLGWAAHSQLRLIFIWALWGGPG